MASFTVSYLFQLRDQFTGPARQIAQSSQKIKASVALAARGMNQTEAATRRAGAAADSAAGSFTRLAQRMRAMRTVGHGMGTLGGLSMLGGAVGGGMTMRNIATTLISFQDAINSAEAKFTKGKGLDPQRLKIMKDAVRELGRTTRFTTTEVGNALNMLAMAGQTFDQAIGKDLKTFKAGALATTLNLAAATGANLPKSADIVTNIMSAYGIAVSDLSRIADTLTYAVNSSNQNIYELAEAMKMAGPASKAFGVSLEDTAAATMALANAGIKGSLAGTGIRRMITRLVSLTKVSQKVFDELGIDKKSYSKNGVLTESIFDVIARFKKAGATTDQIFKIMGDRAGPIMLRLMSMSTKELKELSSELKNAKGAAEKSAAIMEKGLGGAWRRLKSRIEAVKIAIGEDGLAKALSDVADYVTALADAFNTLSPSTKYAVGMAMLAAAAFSAIVIPLGILAWSISALLPLFMMFGGAVKYVLIWGILRPLYILATNLVFWFPMLLNGLRNLILYLRVLGSLIAVLSFAEAAALASSLAIAVAALAVVAAGAVVVWRNWSNIVQGLNIAFQSLKQTLSGLLAGDMKQALSGLDRFVKNWAAGMKNTIKAYLKLGDDIFGTDFANQFETALNKLVEIAKGIGPKIAEKITAPFKGLLAMIDVIRSMLGFGSKASPVPKVAPVPVPRATPQGISPDLGQGIPSITARKIDLTNMIGGSIGLTVIPGTATLTWPNGMPAGKVPVTAAPKGKATAGAPAPRSP